MDAEERLRLLLRIQRFLRVMDSIPEDHPEGWGRWRNYEEYLAILEEAKHAMACLVKEVGQEVWPKDSPEAP